MQSIFKPTLFSFLFFFLFPILSFAQDTEAQENEKIHQENEKIHRKNEKIHKKNEKIHQRNTIIVEQNELRINLEELKIELKNALKELENVNWEEVNQEIEVAMNEARQGMEEAREEMKNIRIEIDEDMIEEMNEDLENLNEELIINNGSPRIRILSQNGLPYKNSREVERNFSELNVEGNSTLSDKMKKETTTLFDATVQNSVKITPQAKEGKFMLNFSLSENKADKKTTYIEVYDAAENVIYFESLVDFSGNYEGEIDLAVNGTDTYTLVVRQGNNYLSRKINLK